MKKEHETAGAADVSFGTVIREFRQRKGLSQEQLGAKVQVKKNAVGAWEAGRSRPDLASIPTLCRELEIPLHVFFGTREDSYDAALLCERFSRLNASHRKLILRQMDLLYQRQHEHSMPPRKLVPLYQNDISAAAGPVSYLQEASGEMVYVVSDEMTSLADEIIRVSGDSMEPTYRDGDSVLVQHTRHLMEGEIGIFINGDAGYIKEYHRDGLYSHNPRYKPIRFSENDSVRCIGRVLGLLHPEQRASQEEIVRFTSSRL